MRKRTQSSPDSNKSLEDASLFRHKEQMSSSEESHFENTMIFPQSQICNIMKIQILLPVLLISALALFFTQHHPEDKEMTQYIQWMKKYGKKYTGEELSYRLAVYKQSLKRVEEHNADALKGKYHYTLELNKYASMTDQQYKLLHTNPFHRSLSTTTHCNSSIEDTPQPKDEIDWTKRASSPVQDEGECSSSWAFAATGALQGLYALDKSKILKLSDQQLLDCTQPYGNEGCNGGLMDQALWYVIDNGITSNQQYAYTGNVSKCQYKASMQMYKIKDCAEVPSGNYSKLISAVNQQPVAVAVAGSNLKLYKQGIFDGECGQDIDTGMVLLGYGSENEVDFWRLKNSKGSDWGMNGTVLIQRTSQDGAGKCGIQLLGTVPKISV